ncbi:MAG: type II toxin-antitoxin system RelE/ParE family toxin [Lachnospiraceae bacterium]|nr:type II toxin-antitoxin system RelE/ParE family toxin [Lachnospiraceae bacterium]MBR5666060.1 type II toxin-antitoxin system RelE/ParE family toxin [Lachnospiraceae bacterium]
MGAVRKVFEVLFYECPDGHEPAREFLEGLEPKMRSKMDMLVTLLQEYGNLLQFPYSEHLADGIFELRAKFGSDISRVLYFFYVGKRIVLTNGFVKKTQKTPPREIELAKKYRKDYLERKEG